MKNAGRRFSSKWYVRPHHARAFDHPTLVSYNYAWVRDCACACAFASEQEGGRSHELGGLSIQRTQNNDNVFQAALWAEDDERLFVAFRGTSSGRDALVDVTIEPEPVPGLGYVHKGFWNRAKRVRLESIVYAAHQRRKQLVLCGHSLGGAVACLVLARLLLRADALDPGKMEQPPEDADAWRAVAERALCVTFGQPQFAESDNYLARQYEWQKARIF
eukprot:tig00000411_g530.t1